jgi:hypothetical protein
MRGVHMKGLASCDKSAWQAIVKLQRFLMLEKTPNMGLNEYDMLLLLHSPLEQLMVEWKCSVCHQRLQSQIPGNVFISITGHTSQFVRAMTIVGSEGIIRAFQGR